MLTCLENRLSRAWLPVVLGIMLVLTIAPVSANTQYIIIDEDIFRYNTPTTVKFINLNATTRYLVNWTTSDSGFDFWSENVGEPIDIIFHLSGGDDDTVFQTLYLRNYTTGAVIDSVTLYYINSDYFDISDIFNSAPYVIGFGIVGLCLLGLPILILRRAK